MVGVARSVCLCDQPVGDCCPMDSFWVPHGPRVDFHEHRLQPGVGRGKRVFDGQHHLRYYTVHTIYPSDLRGLNLAEARKIHQISFHELGFPLQYRLGSFRCETVANDKIVH